MWNYSAFPLDGPAQNLPSKVKGLGIYATIFGAKKWRLVPRQVAFAYLCCIRAEKLWLIAKADDCP
jgi:hypothetical protein